MRATAGLAKLSCLGIHSSPQSGAKNTHLKGLLLELSALEMIPFLLFYVSAFFWKPPQNPLEVVEYQS